MRENNWNGINHTGFRGPHSVIKLSLFAFLLFSLFSCNNERAKQEEMALYSKIEPRHYEGVICRTADIDSIFNKKELYECLNLKIYDEPCAGDIRSDQFVRLVIAPLRQGKVKIVSFSAIDGCWMKSTKEIQRNEFGVFPYLVNGADINYSVVKKESNSKALELAETLVLSFDLVDTGEEAEILYILEVKNGGLYNKYYSNSNRLDEQAKLVFNSLIEY